MWKTIKSIVHTTKIWRPLQVDGELWHGLVGDWIGWWLDLVAHERLTHGVENIMFSTPWSNKNYIFINYNLITY